jgi:hypothetical protein
MALCFAGWTNFDSLNAQGMTDIDTVWTAIVPERSQFTNAFALSNGNYLAYGWNGYGTGSTVYDNSTGSNKNEVYIAEFTEAGNILRYKTIEANISSSHTGRTFITHSRVVERLNDGGLLILSEFNHGGSNPMSPSYQSAWFVRMILDKDWNVTSNGLFSLTTNNFLYSGSTYSTTTIGIRVFDIEHVSEGQLLATYKCVRNQDYSNYYPMQGVIFLNYDGNPVSPDSRPAARIYDYSGTYTTTSIVRNNNYYLFTESGQRVWRSTDLTCTGFSQLPSVACSSAPYCHPDRAKDIVVLPNSGGFAVHAPTGLKDEFFNDYNNQYGVWRWNSNISLTQSTPVWHESNQLLSGFTLMNNAIFDYNNQDRYLVKSVKYSPNTNTPVSSRIAQLIFSNSTYPQFEEGPDLLAPALSMSLFSLDSSGIICGGTIKVNNQSRIQVGKLSMCKDFTLTPNKSYISGVALPEFTFYANGEYPGAEVSYSWRVLLKSGKLESPYAEATVGTVLASGTGNTIPQTVYTADLSDSKPAVLLVEYSATQRWGVQPQQQQVCRTSSSYEITLVSAPDNVVNALCYSPLTGVPWGGLAQSYSGQNNLSPHQSVMVGDIDGDGIVEILAAANPVDNADVNSRTASGIAIYKGNNISQASKVIPTSNFNWNYRTKFGLVRTKISNKDTTLIVLACSDRQLRAYNYDGSQIWESSSSYPYHSSLNDGLSPAFADVNHDGIPEIAIGGKLYNSSNGAWICEIPSSSCPFINDKESMNVQIVDVYNNGEMKYVVGNCIYKININASNVIQSLTLDKKILPPGSCPDGGKSLFVDINKDGAPDMIVAHAYSGGYVTLYIANPVDGKIRASVNIPSSSYCGYPSVGDVNGDGDNEIILVTAGTSTNRKIRCYKYNGTESLATPWSAIDHDDASGATGLTLFDLDRDGSIEIVHRDNTVLRVIDGRNSSSYLNRNKSTSPNLSETGAEYPVVADVDGDGHAEIVVVGGLDGDADNTYKGRLWIYRSGDLTGSPWAAARKVWNQYAYQPVYVNENLTVPKYPQNPATIFPGENHEIDEGGGDDVQPYNNYMQQQTILNINGTTFQYASDVRFITNPVPTFTYYGAGDSLVISMQLINVGQAALTAPFYISAYKNETLAMNKMTTGDYNLSIAPNSTVSVKLKVLNISTYAASKIILRLNNKDGINYDQAECDYGNNDYEYSPTSIPKAVNDTTVTLMNTAVSIDVRENDDLSSCPAATPTVTVIPTKGSASIVNNSIVYTPINDFYGIDSLVYRLTCNFNITEAKVYIIVNKPMATSYIECNGNTVTAGFAAITNVTYFWYSVETGGAPNPAGSTLTKSVTAPNIWYVEARYKDKPVKPRLTVTVDAYPALTGGKIGSNQTLCYNSILQPFTSTTAASGGNGTATYEWQYSIDETEWKPISNSNSAEYTHDVAPTQTTYYRRQFSNDCGTVYSDTVTITVRSASLYAYPDIRVRVCRDANTLINLSKYIDTLDVIPSSIKWESISPKMKIINDNYGIISTDDFNSEFSRVYTFTYSLENPCSNNIKGKLYLEVLKNNRMRPLRDTIVICHERAEMLQINQLFGIDARGSWTFEGDGDLTPYITISTSALYEGAAIINGKDIYADSSIGNYTYKGITDAKRVTITYITHSDSCLNGKEYKIVVILINN